MPLRQVLLHVVLLCVGCRLGAEALLTKNENCGHCPAVFGLGNQKAGSTVIGHVLAKALGLEFQNDIFGAWCPSTFMQRKVEGHPRLDENAQPTFMHNENAQPTFMHNLTDRALCNMMPKNGSRVLAKEGHLTLLKDHISSLCPETKFYFNVRHPVSNIISLIDRLQVAYPLLNVTPTSLLASPSAISQEFSCGWRDVVDMRYAGVDEENVLSALTRRWTMMVDVYFNTCHRAQLVKYEDIVSEKYRTELIQRVAHNLGVKEPHIDEALASMGQQLQNRGDHHHPFDPAAWKAYLGDEIYNSIVLKAQPHMTRLGYGELAFRRRYGE